MQVFLSWSTERSKALAAALYEWLPQVIQSTEPWFSAESIEAGTVWRAVLLQQLAQDQYGVVCVTPENVARPWLNFEAGILAKAFTAARVTPVCLGLSPADVKGPISELQGVTADKEGIEKLVASINAQLGDKKLPKELLTKVFKTNWPELEKKIAAIPPASGPQPPPRTQEDKTDEMLGILRELRNDMWSPARAALRGSTSSWLQAAIGAGDLTPEGAPSRLSLADLYGRQASGIDLVGNAINAASPEEKIGFAAREIQRIAESINEKVGHGTKPKAGEARSQHGGKAKKPKP